MLKNARQAECLAHQLLQAIDFGLAAQAVSPAILLGRDFFSSLLGQL